MEAATLSMILAGAGVGLSAYSAYAQQRAQNRAAEHQAQMAARNAETAEVKARDVEERGRERERKLRRHIAITRSSQRLGYAKAGVQLGPGSAMETLRDTDYLGEQDALALRHNTAMEAWATRRQAQNYRGQSAQYRSQTTSPLLTGGATLLTGAVRAYDRFSA